MTMVLQKNRVPAPLVVVPAEAGTQKLAIFLDSRLHGNDKAATRNAAKPLLVYVPG